MSRRTRDDIEALVIGTLAEISPGCGPVVASTALSGDGAVVDSVGLVTLLVSLEEGLHGAVDLSASFIEHGDAEEGNPFRTIGSLTDHIHGLAEVPS